MNPVWEKEEETVVEEKVVNSPAILIYNDDDVSFEHVIDCLMRYCEHGYEQAVQCAMIADNKGKCDVKHGEYEKLRPIWEALVDAGIPAKIEV